MICYRDTTFCAAADKCATKDCPSRLSALDVEVAHTVGLPISRADFSLKCGMYKEKKRVDDKRVVVYALLDRLEAAEKESALMERVIDALGLELNAVANERDELRAKIEAMERQEPAGWQRLYEDGSSTEDIVDSPNVFVHQRPLYALPGAQTQGEEK